MPIIEADEFEQGRWRKQFEFASNHNLDDGQLVDFLKELSKTLLTDKKAREFPDVITFGYFCRPANIKRILADLDHLDQRSGWGTAVHVTPGNIPVNFAFSFVMGFLSGNSNIVRVPSQIFTQVSLIVCAIDLVLQKKEFMSLSSQIAFVRTDRDSAQLEKCVQDAQCLLVWGADDTVNKFRKFPKSPNCVDVYFPDKASSLVIQAAAYLQVSNAELETISRNFFNDTFLVDQNACSSPNMIFWHGEHDEIEAAQQAFWTEIGHFVGQQYQLDPVAKNDKMLDVMRMGIRHNKTIKVGQHSNNIWLLDDPALHQDHLKYGTFLEIALNDLHELAKYLRSNEQTLTVLGMPCEQVFQVLKRQNRAVDRIVPMGKALDMGHLWDGKNLLSSLSRRTEVG